MPNKKIDSTSFATDEKMTDIFNVFASVINAHVKIPIGFIFLLDDKEELRINVEKTQYVSNFLDHFTIRITRDIIKYICDVFYVVLSDNSLFSDVGKSSHIINIPTLHVPSWSVLDLAMQNTELPSFDDERRKLHSYLFSLATEFIMVHEALHVLNGHSDYLLNRKERIESEEIIEELTPLDYQTLEYDADCVATFKYLNFIMQSDKEIPDILNNKQKILHCFMFTISIILFGLPGQFLKNLDDLTNQNHLTSLIRMQFFFETIINLFENYPEETKYFEKGMGFVLGDFKKLVDHEIMPKNIIDELKGFQNPHIQEHMTKIIQNWLNKWFKNLQPFALIQLYK